MQDQPLLVFAHEGVPLIVIAHRGACKEELENSYSAFDLALSSGAKRIEFDIQCTKDHRFVVIHDDDLERVTGHPGKVSESTLTELNKLRLLNGDPIPTLEDMLQRYRSQIELNLEFKPSSTHLAKLLASALKPFKPYEDLIVSSFHPDPLITLKSLEPSLPLACLWDGHWQWQSPSLNNPKLFLEHTHAVAFHPSIEKVTKEWVQYAHSHDMKVYTYAGMTEEDDDRESIWSYLVAIGVDGHCTNYPAQMVSWLREEQDYGIEHS